MRLVPEWRLLEGLLSMVDVVQGFQLSAGELRSMVDWPDELIEDWLELIRSVNLLLAGGVQDGTVNPNGNVTANFSKLYVDTTGPTLYYNETIGADTGWVAL